MCDLLNDPCLFPLDFMGEERHFYTFFGSFPTPPKLHRNKQIRIIFTDSTGAPLGMERCLPSWSNLLRLTWFSMYVTPQNNPFFLLAFQNVSICLKVLGGKVLVQMAAQFFHRNKKHTKKHLIG